jgi:pimeloyl-ACP methyl ester carboxylesterase
METPPRLVLVPGLDGTVLLFGPFLRVWKGPVTVLPLPADPAQGYDELLANLARNLPEEPFLLLCESFSGPLGIRIAAAPLASMLGLILCVSFARNPLGCLAGPARALAQPALLARLPMSLVRRRLLGDWATPELLALLDTALLGLSGKVVAARIQALSRVDATSALEACRTPVLVLSARSDAVVPRRCARHLLRHAPQARGQEFPGPHLLLQTQPVGAAESILTFLDSLQVN